MIFIDPGHLFVLAMGALVFVIGGTLIGGFLAKPPVGIITGFVVGLILTVALAAGYSIMDKKDGMVTQSGSVAEEYYDAGDHPATGVRSEEVL